MKLLNPLLLFGLLLFAIPAGAASPVRYVDATTLTVIGKALPTELPYNRIDTTRFQMPEKTHAYCYYSTGLAVVFRTDSRTIRARWETSGRNSGPNMTAIAQKGLDLYIRQGEQWIYAGVGIPKIDGKNDRHDATIVSDMPKGEKECLLYLPLYDRLDKLEIGIEEQSDISPMENPFRRKIVVHGSSITHGSSASRAGMTYTARFGRHTGLYCINLGFSGLCTMQPEFAAYLSQVETDAFIFDCFSNPRAEIIDERFDAFVDTIRKTHPATPMIFLQTIRRETRNFSTRIEKIEYDKQAAAEAKIRERMKSDKHIYFVDPGELLGDDHIATVDGTHPTDLGFTRMLERIEPQVRQILRAYDIE
ncbi:SGNH/GDSL hydrolase family protein [uncultured Alistipes sp.]|jgi:hypothetical protein|uniref:SGNH/GDSL hydrolase family protein n=1 Tax=uncultured Alistipes sp. TaxID=538949 RepID=UPI0026002728|nr:SGNH/GDSL hydrolase family protein [uncultured Alistipes sp.]